MKFIRRAVEDDKNLAGRHAAAHRREQVPAAADVDDAGASCVGGFPKTREELFAYRGLILGSVEAGAFTADQLRMIADFVEQRGGGLLMLGGPRAFAEGGWAGTPVAEVLPVAIERGRAGARHAAGDPAPGAADARRRKRTRVTQIAGDRSRRRPRAGATCRR